MVSTKHTHEKVTAKRHSGTVDKPKAIVDYNSRKSSIDVYKQLDSYNMVLMKTVKW